MVQIQQEDALPPRTPRQALVDIGSTPIENLATARAIARIIRSVPKIDMQPDERDEADQALRRLVDAVVASISVSPAPTAASVNWERLVEDANTVRTTLGYTPRHRHDWTRITSSPSIEHPRPQPPRGPSGASDANAKPDLSDQDLIAVLRACRDRALTLSETLSLLRRLA